MEIGAGLKRANMSGVIIVAPLSQASTQALNKYLANNFGLITVSTNGRQFEAMIGTGNTVQNQNKVIEIRESVLKELSKIGITPTHLEVIPY